MVRKRYFLKLYKIKIRKARLRVKFIYGKILKKCSVLKNMPFYCRKRIKHMLNYLRSFWRRYPIEDKSQIAQICLAILTLLLVCITFWGITQSNKYTRQQIELQNRPFLAIVNPGYFIKPIETGQWQYAGYFPTINYGNKPAYELEVINDKVILIETSGSRLDELNRIQKDDGKNQTEKDIAYAQYVLYRKILVKIVYDYLKNNPRATNKQLTDYFSDNNNLRHKVNPACLDSKGNLDFKIDSRGDIGLYQEPSLLLPYRPETDNPKKIFQLGREIHPNTDEHIKTYSKILLVYVAAQYEGAVKQDKPYCIYYIGYHDEFLSPVRIKNITDYEKENLENKNKKVIPLIGFTEFKMWSDRTIIK